VDVAATGEQAAEHWIVSIVCSSRHHLRHSDTLALIWQKLFGFGLHTWISL